MILDIYLGFIVILLGIESVFLCIYNYTVYDEPKRTFVIPDLNRSSLLHVVSSKQESSV